MKKFSIHFFILLFLPFVKLYSQQMQDESFLDIRSQYENLKKNDIRALPYVSNYIRKAKVEANYVELTQAYRDAVMYSPDETAKLVYSDSMIIAAEKSRDNSLMTLAYLGKGIIFYFNYKKFEPALDQYLKAYEYSKKTDDQYLKYKVIYHLGVVKSYLGYYADAIEHFNSCIDFFEKESKKSDHSNEVYNNKRGYYNSLHQMIICHRNLNHQRISDSLIHVGINKINRETEFSLERSYLLKCRGISEFNHKNYNNAITDLEAALPELSKKDFSWASVLYFYLGECYMRSDMKRGLSQFEKVDSLFNRHQFILPEVRKNYEILIRYWRDKKDISKELYYTNQLLEVDSTIGKDFTFLSSRIHKEYDTRDLLEKKEFLEQKSKSRLSIIIAISSVAFLMIFVLGARYRKERSIRLKYEKLQARLLQQKTEQAIAPDNFDTNKKSVLSQELIEDLSEKIAKFEMSRGFVKKGLSLHHLASQFGTNYKYLSIFINDTKGVNFKNYLNRLRINYITGLLNTDRKFLHYTTEALADECGIATRQSFSDLFYEINGIRPQDYIRKRKKELERP